MVGGYLEMKNSLVLTKKINKIMSASTLSNQPINFDSEKHNPEEITETKESFLLSEINDKLGKILEILNKL